MQVKKLTIGNYQTENNIFLAPMAGYTDYAFRHICLEYGAGLVYTELVSAKGLYYGGNGSQELLFSDEDYNKTVPQIFGSDPYFMRCACEREDFQKFPLVDINMGCPVPKVYKNGEGSALLNDLKKVEEIIKECCRSGKLITVKTRIGIKKGDNVATEFSKMAENAGAKLITIHGRVRDDYYSGDINYDAIYNAKKSVSIPVIANGGIYTIDDANKMLDKTGADGIMIARGAISNPFIFSQLQGKITNIDIKKVIKDYILLAVKNKGEKTAVVEFRKYVPYFLKGFINVKETKIALMRANTLDEILSLIEKI